MYNVDSTEEIEDIFLHIRKHQTRYTADVSAHASVMRLHSHHSHALCSSVKTEIQITYSVCINRKLILQFLGFFTIKVIFNQMWH